jgi:protease PrsW
VQAVVSLVFAVVPMILYLWVVWMMDRYDREPIGLLALNFLWGAVGAVVISLAASIGLARLLGLNEMEQRLFLAPVVEECAKGVFLLWTARNRNFDNITDGVVYGMAIGLGFGMTENFLYFLHAESAEKWVQRVIIRTIFTALMHAMATGCFGVTVGLSKYRFRRWRLLLGAAGLAAAMALHYGWNLWSAGTGILDMVLIAMSLGVILLVMQVSLFTENQLMLRELLEEVRTGLLPQVHLNYLPYSSKRKMLGWLPPSIDRKQYIQLATRLAFRKSQYRYTSGPEQAQYAAEIETLRTAIDDILQTESRSDAARLY